MSLSRRKYGESAGIAVDPQKTSGQYAIQKCAQFLLHKARYNPVSLPLSSEEGLQMAGNDIIKDRLFGITGYIRSNAFTNDELRFSGLKYAIAG